MLYLPRRKLLSRLSPRQQLLTHYRGRQHNPSPCGVIPERRPLAMEGLLFLGEAYSFDNSYVLTTGLTNLVMQCHQAFALMLWLHFPGMCSMYFFQDQISLDDLKETTHLRIIVVQICFPLQDIVFYLPHLICCIMSRNGLFVPSPVLISAWRMTLSGCQMHSSGTNR